MCKVGNIYLSNAVDVCYIKLYHVKRSYQKMYLRDWSGWGGQGGGGSLFLILEFSIQYHHHHSHICISHPDKMEVKRK